MRKRDNQATKDLRTILGEIRAQRLAAFELIASGTAPTDKQLANLHGRIAVIVRSFDPLRDSRADLADAIDRLVPGMADLKRCFAYEYHTRLNEHPDDMGAVRLLHGSLTAAMDTLIEHLRSEGLPTE